MAKGYKLNKITDMKRLMRDLEREAKRIAKKRWSGKASKSSVPRGAPMHASPDLNSCSSCGEMAKVTFDRAGL